jgi:hypothetical protein
MRHDLNGDGAQARHAHSQDAGNLRNVFRLNQRIISESAEGLRSNGQGFLIYAKMADGAYRESDRGKIEKNNGNSSDSFLFGLCAACVFERCRSRHG